MRSNFEETFLKFIKILKVPITQTSAFEYLKSHPNEGSLLAYAETLDRFKIENAGIKIDKDRFEELPTPFVAYLHQYGGIFALVKEVNGSKVRWLDTQKGWIETAKEDFLKSWQGIALLAETTSESGEKNYTKKRQGEILNLLRIPFAFTLLVLVKSVFIIPILINVSSSHYSLLILLKIGGMTLSSLLLIKSIDSKNELVNKLCNNGPKVNCQSILDSPAARITSWLSWSDLGFIYFFGSFFALLLGLYSDTLSTFFTFQWFFSAGSIFFSVYSLWYQGIKSKMWCTLCLVIIAAFVLEFLFLLIFSSFNLEATWVGMKYIVVGFAIPIIFLLLYKDTAKKALERNSLKRRLDKIYANPEYYRAIMENQPVMPDIPKDMPTVFFGNPEAENVITIVSNPLCSPCASMHRQLEELVEENPDVKCQVIFLSEENDAGGLFVRKILSLPQDIQAVAMSKWFNRNDKNFEKWNEEYTQYSENEKVFSIQKLHNMWINYAEVKGTPTLFINKKMKSDGISVKDVSLMLTMHKKASLD